MPFFALLICCLGVWAGSPIISSYNLTFRLPSETGNSADLNYLIQGQNLTYEISGNYTDSSGSIISAPQPTVSQRLRLVSTVSKPVKGVMNANYSQILQDSINGNLIYTFDGPYITVWDISTISNPVLKSTSPQFYSNLTSFGQFTVGTGDYLMLVSAINQPILTIGVANVTNATAISYVPGLTVQFTLPDVLKSIRIEESTTSIVILISTASTVEIYSQAFSLSKPAFFVYSINATSLNVTKIAPILADIAYPQGLLCDAVLGVVIFDAGSILSNPQQKFLPVIVTDDAPLAFGRMLSCEYFEQYLVVTTSNGVPIYDVIANSLLPQVEFPHYLHANEQPQLADAAGMSFPWYAAEYEVSVMLDGSNVTTLRVYADYFINVQRSIICDVWLPSLFPSTDLSQSPTPAFLPVQLPPSDYLIFNSYSALYVYQLSAVTLMSVDPDLGQAYWFSGSLGVSNDEQLATWMNFPLEIYGLDSEASTIYQERGAFPNDLFLAPSLISGFLDETPFSDLYLPLSNYLSGHNLTYEITQISANADNINVTLPPKSALLHSYTFPDISTNTAIVQLPVLGLMVVAVIHSGKTVIFDLSGDLELIETLESSVAENSIFNVAGVAFSTESVYTAFALIESGSIDFETGTYNITWDFYDVTDPTQPDLALTVLFPESVPSFSIYSQNIAIFALRGSIIETYFLNYTNGTFSLESGTSVTTENMQNMFEIDPIAMVLSVDGLTLFLYDLLKGVVVINVANITVTNYRYLTVPGSVQTPNPGILLETSPHYLYLLFPKAGAIPQIIQYDISDLTDVEQVMYYPTLGQCAYTDLSAGSQTLSVVCASSSANSVYIFDPDSMSYENLYTAIPIPMSGSILADPDSTVFDYVTIYDGQSLYRFSLIQNLKFGYWSPSSPLLDSNNPALSVWAKIDFPTTESPQRFYNASYEIQACSGLSGLCSSQVLDVSMENGGTYLYPNPDVSPVISYFTAGGELTIGNYSISIGVPDLAFIGGDIQYQVLVQESGSNFTVNPTSFCDRQTNPCLLAKSSLIQTINESDVTAISMKDEYLVLAGLNQLIVWEFQDGIWVPDEVIFLEDMGLGNETVCGRLKQLDGTELMLAECKSRVGDIEAQQFIAVLNLTSLPNTPIYEIDFDVAFLTSSFNSFINTWLVYMSDGLNVYILKVSPGTNIGQYQLTDYSLLNAINLGLDNFWPVSLAPVNDTHLFISDFYSFSIIRFVLNLNSPGTYTIFDSFQSYEAVVGMRIGKDRSTLFALTSSADVIVLTTTMGDGTAVFTVTQVVKSLNPSIESVSIYGQLTIGQYEQWLAFPIYDGQYFTVRIVDLKANVHSEVYTSLGPGPLGDITSNFQVPLKQIDTGVYGGLLIPFQDDWTIQVIVLQYFQSFIPPPMVYQITKFPNVTFYPSKTTKTDTMFLVAFNDYSTYTCSELTVNYL